MLQGHGDGHPDRWDAPELKQRLLAAYSLLHGVSSFELPPVILSIVPHFLSKTKTFFVYLTIFLAWWRKNRRFLSPHKEKSRSRGFFPANIRVYIGHAVAFGVSRSTWISSMRWFSTRVTSTRRPSKVKLSPASGTRPNCSMTQPLTDTISESVLRWK